MTNHQLSNTGYFEFSVLWCLVIGAALNSTSKVLLQRRVRKAVLQERAASNTRTQMFSDLETCHWLNQILSGVYGNHHKYISLLFVRFANGLLQELCTPAPIESVSFAQLDVGLPGPKLSNIVVKLDDLKAKSLNFDFTVDYITDFNGVVLSKLARTPEMFVNISNLTFNCRMRFKVEFLSDKFPFLKSLGWSFLSKPAINISVRASALPGYLEMPSITEHFLESVRERMYFKIGTPKLVEGDFTRFSDNGDVAHQAERFLQALPMLVQEMIKHGELVVSEQEAQNTVLKRGKKFRKDRDLTSMSVPPRPNSPLVDPGRPLIPRVETLAVESIPVISAPNQSRSLAESAETNLSSGRSRRSRSFNTDQKLTSPDLSPHKRRHSIDSSDEGIKLMSLTNPLSDSEEQTFELVSPRRRANTDQLVPSPVMVPKHALNKSSSVSVDSFAPEKQSPGTKEKERKKVRHLASKLKRVFKNE